MKKFAVLMITVTVLMITLIPDAKGQILPPGPRTDRLDFGMVGITAGQTARLNVVNIGGEGDGICMVELTFFDSVGNTLDTFSMDIEPGNSAFNDAEGSGIAGAEPSRVQIRAVVLRNLNGNTRCNVIPTLEVFDTNTGKTTLMIGTPNVSADPNLIEDLLNLLNLDLLGILLNPGRG